MPSKHRFNRIALAAVVLAAGACTSSVASELGHALADQVSLDSYQDFMDNWLYTHLGDDRGRTGYGHFWGRQNIVDWMESFGLSVTWHIFPYQGNNYYNIVGEKLGTTYPEQVYIIGAHFDSVSNPGADDNASGVALVLEAARVLTQYPSAHTIRFIAFDLEELGLLGSEAYANDHVGEDILGMISTDMVAHDPGANEASIFGRSASLPLKNSVAAAVEEYSGGLTPSIGGDFPASDHAPFEWVGFQACLLIEGAFWDNPWYHTPLDAYETEGNLNFEFATQMTRSVVGWLVDVAGVYEIPLIAGDMNCDGVVDFFDIEPFMLALTDPDEYDITYPACDLLNADTNGDGEIDFFDIDPFVTLITG